MKILYINNYRESSGWSEAGRQMILSMDSVGINIVPRPLFITGNNCDIPNRIKELEQKNANNCTHVIQHVLPHMLEYNGYFKKNICLFASETNFNNSNWAKYLSLMSELWTINSSQLESCFYNNINKPVKVVPHPCDINKYKFNGSLNLPIMENDIVYYCIIDYTRRKNLPALLKAFHLEFDRLDNVQLLLKVSKSGVSPNDLRQEVGKMINEIKTGLKLYSNLTDYKQELVLTDNLSDEQLLSLHNSADVYVNSSLGEAWCLPLFDAAAIGNYVISTHEGGPRDYLSGHSYGKLVKANKEACFGFNDTIGNLYTGNEFVSNIDVTELRLAMRSAYNLLKEKNRQDRKNRAAGFELAQRYSYNRVGNLIKSILEN